MAGSGHERDSGRDRARTVPALVQLLARSRAERLRAEFAAAGMPGLRPAHAALLVPLLGGGRHAPAWRPTSASPGRRSPRWWRRWNGTATCGASPTRATPGPSSVCLTPRGRAALRTMYVSASRYRGRLAAAARRGPAGRVPRDPARAALGVGLKAPLRSAISKVLRALPSPFHPKVSPRVIRRPNGIRLRASRRLSAAAYGPGACGASGPPSVSGGGLARPPRWADIISKKQCIAASTS